MHHSDKVKAGDCVSDIETGSSPEALLAELSSMVAKILSASRCSIHLLSERQIAEIRPRQRAEFGHPAISRYDMVSVRRCEPCAPYAMGSEGVGALVVTSPAETESDHVRSSMFSMLVLRGKTIGIVHAHHPFDKPYFGVEDLRLLDNLAPLIVKAIQANQMQHLMKSRFTQVALTHSSEKTVKEIIAGSAQNTNQIARILAKSFYREMTNAGFNFNQIIHAASEIISELSNSVRKHKNSRHHRSEMDQARNSETLPRATDESLPRDHEVSNELPQR
ncbi:GAF domain-containing protein [Paraburkholderia phymatum]|uniref:Putative GAF sensor protein n=1 Tax=Paraburkholderia phymatum (strain DSM 17167 / CIP 108236 / LMG 21445 / STM815) TaxID=391038 RepID=B2JFE2_PARP8|nr:GAF domain-containing protein [Paraburkholderia phymatum]ACC71510.1 putative GAF sensor protein [Paraburkholderia phymatum STM815]